MKHLDLTQATDTLASYIQKLGDDKLVVVHDGEAVAVLMPITESELEDMSLSKNPEFIAILEQSKNSLRSKGGSSLLSGKATVRLNLSVIELHGRRAPIALLYIIRYVTINKKSR